MLERGKNQLPALRLYERLGFRITGGDDRKFYMKRDLKSTIPFSSLTRYPIPAKSLATNPSQPVSLQRDDFTSKKAIHNDIGS